jgi:Ca-activated chloride channel family protein
MNTLHATTAVPQRGLASVDGREYPLRSATLRTRAGAGVAATTLEQTFGNPFAEPLEAVYTMPLPADGAVVGYRIRIGERTIVGEIEVREAATKRYREALAAGHTAGLLEQQRADTFTQSLGNVPPGAEVQVEIDVVQPLAFVRSEGSAPEWEWRFPTVVGVRYVGDRGRVPDAPALDAERADTAGTPPRVALELLVTDGAAAELAPRSPSHPVAIEGAETSGAGALPATRISFTSGAALNRDVVVRWNAASAETSVRLLAGSGLPGDDGRYALLTLTPPSAPRAVLPRSLTVLIDASGSMSGRPIEHARAVVLALLRGLVPSDQFELVAFSNTPRSLTGGVVAATPEAVAAAVAAVTQLEAGGGTEMLSALKRALEPLREHEQRQVVLVTDGEIGFEAEVVGEALTTLPAASRIHVVGVGSAPNRTLTRGLARAGRGQEILIALADDPAAAAARLCAATEAPVLVGVTVGGSALVAVAPERPADVFAGRPLTLAVELRPGGGTLELRGTLAGEGAPWAWSAEVAEKAADPVSGLPAGALFGREAIEDLEAGRTPSRGQASAVDAQIERVALRHRIVSSRTSLVAIAEEPAVDPRAPRRRVKLAVEMPEDVSAEGVGFGGAVFASGAAALEAFLAESSSLGPEARSSLACGVAHPAREALHRLYQGHRLADRESIDRFGTVSEAESERQRREQKERARHEQELASRRQRDAEALERMRRELARRPSIAEARVLQLLGDVLLLEFEIPIDEMELPPGGTRATAKSHAGPVLEATVVEERSTYREKYAAGLTVQLALRAAGWESFLAHGLFHVTMEAGGRAIFLSVKQLL